jgi:hypothetical protein
MRYQCLRIDHIPLDVRRFETETLHISYETSFGRHFDGVDRPPDTPHTSWFDSGALQPCSALLLRTAGDMLMRRLVVLRLASNAPDERACSLSRAQYK